LTSFVPRLHSSWRVLLLLLVGLLFFLAVPLPAAAHSRLVQSDPAAGQVLTAGPATVRLTFSEQAALDFSSIQVLDRGRHRLDTGPVTQPGGDRLSLQVGVQPNLPTGIYTGIWRVVSAVDGHLTESSFAFTVLRPGEPTPTPGAEPTAVAGSPGDTGGSQSPEGNTPPPSPIRWLLRSLAL
jgi:methionine-rich copper-binding protein CopC